MKATVPTHEYEIARFVGHSGRIDTLAVHPDGRLLASGARDFNIFLWSLEKVGEHGVSMVSREPQEIHALSPIAVL
jgi:WD40 repeat protein